MFVKDRYGIPMIITETGTDATQGDERIESWLVRHLEWTRRAIKDGADTRGFFYWSLTDNYEWNHGMDMKFGLYAVAKDADKTRTAALGGRHVRRDHQEERHQRGAAQEVPRRVTQAAVAPEEMGRPAELLSKALIKFVPHSILYRVRHRKLLNYDDSAGDALDTVSGTLDTVSGALDTVLGPRMVSR